MIIKNSNIRRILFEARYVIFMIIFGIILVLYLIQVLNENAKEKLKPSQNVVENTVVQTVDKSSQTVISGDNVSSKEQQANTSIIETFIGYCNNKQIEKAYALLTDECKKEVFADSITYFQKNYVDKIFTTKKMYSIQAWVNSYVDTYKVRIVDDMLSTGKVTDSSNVVEDYFTIVEQEDGFKLNINSYIAQQKLDRQAYINGITVTVLNKNIYKEYEEYEIKIENASDKTILLDSQEKTDSIYLVGSNENNYDAFLFEIDVTEITVEPGKTKTLSVRFNKIYSNQVIMEQMVFEDVITDYQNYMQLTDKSQYVNRGKIIIEI